MLLYFGVAHLFLFHGFEFGLFVASRKCEMGKGKGGGNGILLFILYTLMNTPPSCFPRRSLGNRDHLGPGWCTPWPRTPVWYAPMDLGNRDHLGPDWCTPWPRTLVWPYGSGQQRSPWPWLVYTLAPDPGVWYAPMDLGTLVLAGVHLGPGPWYGRSNLAVDACTVTPSSPSLLL